MKTRRAALAAVLVWATIMASAVPASAVQCISVPPIRASHGSMTVSVENQLTVRGQISSLGQVTCPVGTTKLIWEEFYAGDGGYLRQIFDATNDPEFATIASGQPASMGIFIPPTRAPGNLDVRITCVVGQVAWASTTVGMVVAEQFTDIDPGKFYAPSVDWARASKITTGSTCTTFSPDAPVSRWQMAVFLQRLANRVGLPAVGSIDSFSDTSALSTTAREAIGWLSSSRITYGITPAVFNPSGTVTRWQMALFLQRFANLAGLDTTSGPDAFLDTTELHADWRRAIGWLATTGVTAGKTLNSFDPDGVVTRAQMVTFLDRFDLILH